MKTISAGLPADFFDLLMFFKIMTYWWGERKGRKKKKKENPLTCLTYLGNILECGTGCAIFLTAGFGRCEPGVTCNHRPTLGQK